MVIQTNNTTKVPEFIPFNINKMDPLLYSMLRLCTPHTYEKFLVAEINKLPFIKTNVTTRYEDTEKHNLIFQVGKPEDSRTVFSCHMDIVGDVSKGAKDQGLTDIITMMTYANPTKAQEGMIFGAKRQFSKNKTTNELEFSYQRSTLGADDKLGVFILLKLIEAKVPGLYIFHVGEECGAVGSKYLAVKMKEIFKAGYDRAIAFDRANYGDVIAFQRGSRCCSKEFGAALAEALNEHMPPLEKFKNEITGSFTDTASYMDIIPECTNVSVGYWNQHGQDEHFDLYWLMDFLLPAILKVDFEKLPVVRDPAKKESQYSNYHGGNEDHTYNHYGNNSKTDLELDDWSDITVNTPFMQFPSWTPDLGIPHGAKPAVLKKAIDRYLLKASYGVKKDQLVDFIYFQMTYCDLLQEENDVLETQLDTLRKKKGIKVKRRNKSNRIIKEVEEPKQQLVKKNPELDTVSQASLTIDAKFQFLKGLIKFADVVELPGNYSKMMVGFTVGADQWIKKNEDHTEEYTDREVQKVNRLIMSMSTLIDVGTFDGKDLELNELLNSIDQYIKDHPLEGGFEQPQFAQNWENDPIHNVANTLH